ncbi:MAG: hypothetical protein ACO3A2_04495 [Bdellovibrionia bacterium]
MIDLNGKIFKKILILGCLSSVVVSVGLAKAPDEGGQESAQVVLEVQPDLGTILNLAIQQISPASAFILRFDVAQREGDLRGQVDALVGLARFASSNPEQRRYYIFRALQTAQADAALQVVVFLALAEMDVDPETHFGFALDLAQRSENVVGQVEALVGLARLWGRQGDRNQRDAYFAEALSRAQGQDQLMEAVQRAQRMARGNDFFRALSEEE